MQPSATFRACVAVLGIAALGFILFWPRGGSLGVQSRATPAYADIKGSIKSALGQYQVDSGSYPQSLQDLLRQPDGATRWHGPYLDKIPVDPWGDAYIYRFPGKHVSGSYDLLSAGPDGKEGTGDDIVSWK